VDSKKRELVGDFKNTVSDLVRNTQFTVEFHDFIHPEELDGRVERVKRRLVSIGLRRINFSLDNTDVLFINRNLVPL